MFKTFASCVLAQRRARSHEVVSGLRVALHSGHEAGPGGGRHDRRAGGMGYGRGRWAGSMVVAAAGRPRARGLGLCELQVANISYQKDEIIQTIRRLAQSGKFAPRPNLSARSMLIPASHGSKDAIIDSHLWFEKGAAGIRQSSGRSEPITQPGQVRVDNT